MKKSTLLLAVLSVLLIGFVSSKDPFFQIKKNFTLFSEVIGEINEYYVVEIDPERVIRSGISAMLETLDPYTVLIDEADTQEIDFITTGRYAGVGIEAGARNGQLVVIAPVDGYSAARAGIRAGDIILSVNGISSSELNAEDLNNNLRGEPGSKVTLEIERTGLEESLFFELIRERIEIKNVPFYGFANKEAGVGYVILSRFSQNAAEEIKAAIREMGKESEVKSLILDLRNNPGGLLNEAVKTVDIFLPENEEVVSTAGKNRQSRQQFRTDIPAMLVDHPVVILQNQGSASSSEIVAGALQDHDRAVIMGEQSFGKGLVQIIRPLSYSTALKITTSNYYIPSGRSIQSVNYGTNPDDVTEEMFYTKNGRPVLESTGILPDVEWVDESNNMLETALMRHNSYFFFANEYVAENPSFSSTDNELFDAFTSWLAENDFSYETRSERLFNQFEEQLQAEAGTVDSYSGNISAIRRQMQEIRLMEMKESRNKIIREINLELATRYDGSTGRQEMNLKIDPLILMAINLINDTDAYQKLLQKP